MKTALYNQDKNQPPKKLFVVKEHKGGCKVDLAREEDGEAIITDCVVSDNPAEGQCAIESAKPAAVKKAATKPEAPSAPEAKPTATKKKGK